VGVRSWTVASAVIEAGVLSGSTAEPDHVLLVQNLRRNGSTDWTTPGGVIDEGESALGGLVREVVEETGLLVAVWGGLLYEIRVQAPELGWDLRVEVHRAVTVTGELAIGADPDGIVIGSAWASTPQCVDLLGDAHPWVREPLVDWLTQRWTDHRTYEYLIGGSTLEEITVERR